MKKATESPTSRRMIEGRRGDQLYSEGHGADEGKSSNIKEGEDEKDYAAP